MLHPIFSQLGPLQHFSCSAHDGPPRLPGGPTEIFGVPPAFLLGPGSGRVGPRRNPPFRALSNLSSFWRGLSSALISDVPHEPGSLKGARSARLHNPGWL